MPVALGVGCLISVVWAAGVGKAGGLPSIVSAIYLILTASVFPLTYILGSIGLGVPIQRWLAPNASHIWAIRTGLGLGAMLTVTQLLGVTGLLFLQPIAIAPPVVGALLLAYRLMSAKPEYAELRPSLPWFGALPAVGVLLVAACSPPGWLWSSEAGGYDVLSYHLQLPRDWIGMGRVWPVEHNVYSYLPGYMEVAFTQIAVSLGAGGSPTAMIKAEGAPLIASQLLHAWITVVAAMLTASSGTSLSRRVGAKTPNLCGSLAGALVLAAPWSVVTGSMAYNEMAVIALFAAAMVGALEHRVRPIRRGLVAGVLVGAACGCKPTALLFAAPVVGLTLIWSTDRRLWFRLIWPACAGGLVMLMPWLIRNAMAGGNPVFPQLTGLFGTSHWSAEQAARYKAGHTFGGSLYDALRLLVLPDPSDPASTSTRAVHRGLMHPQWSLLAPIALVALVTGVFMRATRRYAVLIAAALLVQLIAWIALTHVQSRFLMPMLVPMALAIAVSISRLRQTAAHAVGVGLVLIPAVTTAVLFSREQSRFGGPNTVIVFGAAQFTSPVSVDQDLREMPPVVFINSQLPADAKVMLIGGAAPLYIDRSIVYATTWDKLELAKLIGLEPENPGRWTSALRDQGVTHVYMDAGEIERLSGSGWFDPVLDPDRIATWLADEAVLIYREPSGRHLIFEMR
ncbi:MAG: hypothetical protein Phyf2KO_15710 [Phycisphaerales bacterium]